LGRGTRKTQTPPHYWPAFLETLRSNLSLYLELSVIITILSSTNGGDLASTRVTKPEVHAEVQRTSLIYLQNVIVANDDNYALAA